jgi:hypothetical protein
MSLPSVAVLVGSPAFAVPPGAGGCGGFFSRRSSRVCGVGSWGAGQGYDSFPGRFVFWQPGFPAFFGAVMVVTPFLPNEKSPGNPGRTKKCRKTGLRQIRPQGGASWGSLAALLVLVRRLELRITAEFIGY